MNKSLALVILAFAALVLALAPTPIHASPPQQVGGTQVVINNPINGMTFQTGQTIGIASTSSAAGGIAFVQLFVDNVAITTSSPPNGAPVSPFFVIQYWTTTPGYHTILVRATSSQGVSGQASIFINVGGGPSGPTNTPNPCVVGARLVSDGNPTPGTQIQPGTSFQKTWQVQNTGSCIWINTYSVLNLSGGALGAPSPSPIPYTQPNQTVTITLNMTAPQSPGAYRSVWQLRAPNGALFGPQLVVQINVPQAGCSGRPQITSFYAIYSLGEAGDDRAYPVLEELCHARDREVREAAREAAEEWLMSSMADRIELEQDEEAIWMEPEASQVSGYPRNMWDNVIGTFSLN